MNKKALTQILSIVLLLGASTTASFAFLGWYSGFGSEFFNSIQEEETSDKLDILNFNSTTLSVRNFAPGNFSYTQIRLEDNECSLTGDIVSNSITNIDVSSCTGSLSEGMTEIRILSPNGVYYEYIYYR